MDFLKYFLGNKDLESNYKRLRRESDNTATGAMLQSDVNRDVLPGNKSPWAKDLSPADLALLDRYSWGAQAGLGGIPTALYSEAVKIPAIQNALKPVTRGLGAVTGYPQAEEWYNTNQTSSPASWSNVGAYIRGALRPNDNGDSFLASYFGD